MAATETRKLRAAAENVTFFYCCVKLGEKQETEDGRQETGDRRQEAGDRTL
jgi:hypothetical protein